jgi:cellulose synthase/poly-beta-1,6-N-acetylglucosamine synthase-like glycosyltransferase
MTRVEHTLKREIRITLLALTVTLVASALFTYEAIDLLAGLILSGHDLQGLSQAVFTVVALFLIYGNLLYQLTRMGYLSRLRSDSGPDGTWEPAIRPPVTILVPSYKEDPEVVRRTLLSAALQDYPDKRVVLLIDDPPNPRSAEDAEGLAAMRRMVGELGELFRGEADRGRAALAEFHERQIREGFHGARETRRLIGRRREIASWLEGEMARYDTRDHQEGLLVREVLGRLVGRHLESSRELEQLVRDTEQHLPEGEIEREYARLLELSEVEITSFERKRYANLSREPNKAANLNSYIGLIGKSFAEASRGGELHLVPREAGGDGFVVPHSDYIVNLDADSILLPGYVSKLVRFVERPEHRRVAVVQTPYSAFPGARKPLERLAGATTDIQYIIHQGFTHYDATFWVGANALIRKAALDDIAYTERERGLEMTRYIKDRTVIEDTESTIDLIGRGWHLYNYPARLAYSATPPDFGALLIQRRRWANGGLLILPNLLSYLGSGPFSRRKIAEGLVRFHYLTSIAGVSLALLLLLLIPFRDNSAVLWLPVASLPYYYLYARDLRLNGYRPSDVLRVYALNLMLVPVNLGGVLKSLHQAWTGEKIPFGRTPKVAGRTRAPWMYVLGEYALLAYSLFAFLTDLAAGRYGHAVFSGVNASFFVYVLWYLIGWRESLEDVTAGALSLFGSTVRAEALD